MKKKMIKTIIVMMTVCILGGCKNIPAQVETETNEIAFATDLTEERIPEENVEKSNPVEKNTVQEKTIVTGKAVKDATEENIPEKESKEVTSTEKTAGEKEQKVLATVTGTSKNQVEKVSTIKTSEVTSEEKKTESAYTEKAVHYTMYGAFYGTTNRQMIYSKAGTEYESVIDPLSHGNAYVFGSNEVTVLGETSNGWYHIQTITSHGPAFSERVTGYVPASALIDSATRARLVEEYQKKQEEENKRVEEYLKKLEEEQKQQEEQKQEEKKSETPSERAAVTPPEQQTETQSEKRTSPPVPTPELIEQWNKEYAEEVEKENERRKQEGNNWPISVSANRAVFDEINAYRVENGLEPLAWGGADMEGIGSVRACEQTDLVVNKYQEMSHAFGTPWNGLENLCGGGRSEGAFESWRTSPGHNMTMLRPELKECVVYTGYYEVTTQGRTYAGVHVALFR